MGHLCMLMFPGAFYAQAFDTPENLLKDKGGYFARQVRRTSPSLFFLISRNFAHCFVTFPAARGGELRHVIELVRRGDLWIMHTRSRIRALQHSPPVSPHFRFASEPSRPSHFSQQHSHFRWLVCLGLIRRVHRGPEVQQRNDAVVWDPELDKRVWVHALQPAATPWQRRGNAVAT